MVGMIFKHLTVRLQSLRVSPCLGPFVEAFLRVINLEILFDGVHFMVGSGVILLGAQVSQFDNDQVSSIGFAQLIKIPTNA